MDIKLLLQIAGVLLGLLYLWLEYRADIRLWIVGLVMPLIHGALYYKSGLYADCSMQAYYVLAGLYGWLKGVYPGEYTEDAPLDMDPRLRHLIPAGESDWAGGGGNGADR